MPITVANEIDYIDVLRIWALDWRIYEREDIGELETLMDRLHSVMSVVAPCEVTAPFPSSYEGGEFPYDAVIVDFQSQNQYIIDLTPQG